MDHHPDAHKTITDVLVGVRYPARDFNNEAVRLIEDITTNMALKALTTAGLTVVSTQEIADLRAERDDLAADAAYCEEVLWEVAKVYDHITEGRISKPNTLAVHVIGEADACFDRWAQAAIAEAIASALHPEGES